MAQASPEKRKWSARVWWLAMHVYVYAALAYNGALSAVALSTRGLVLTLTVATANALCYAALQLSSPGFVEHAADLESGGGGGGGGGESELAEDSDALVSSGDDGGAGKHDAELHFCDVCQLTQPLRTKHCKDCGKCVRQYDHHCDCAGTCVGEKNRRRFVLYLAVQAAEAFAMIGVAADAFTLQDSVDEWFNVNWPFIIAWLSIACVLVIVTSWEHARRSSITYLRSLSDADNSPFDRGCLANWRVFCAGGDANKWVHSASRAPPTAASSASSSSASAAM